MMLEHPRDVHPQARDDESQDAAKIPPPIILDRWVRGTRYVVRCTGIRCYPQNVHADEFGCLRFECFRADCPALSAVTD